MTSLLALALLGGVLTGIPMARVAKGLERASGLLTEALGRQIRSRILLVSITTRIAITIGIVFLMIRKPDPIASIFTIGLVAALGILLGFGI
jgi:hypothetical protein